ncbi:hypothetical protein [Rivularia sp. UHCC 0363]|uniref:hypothetical protein n=1 Tax=Rivularia sp. UHCC 0363 TaxID=3110244 RepID=UPI002B215C77|nr:hypothetical protein [Rivularia sp. UHCC 0363]MEA5595685.1 hypothetical protein [Rivularia sp. UHCC 0363]
MTLEERIEDITKLDFKQGIVKGSSKTDLYNPFGRTESLTELLKIKVTASLNDKLRSLPNYAEVVRLILEDDIKSGKFLLRKPTRLKTGAGAKFNQSEPATSQLGVRVSKNFLEEIKQHKGWGSKVREALEEAIADLDFK